MCEVEMMPQSEFVGWQIYDKVTAEEAEKARQDAERDAERR